MQRDELVDKITKDLDRKLESIDRPSGKRAYLFVHPDRSLEVNRYLYELGGRLATATGVDSRDYIEVLYHYCFDSINIVVTVEQISPTKLKEVNVKALEEGNMS